MSDEKKHVTVLLTEDMVREARVCGAVEHYKALLPAKISTDPEKNLRLAVKLAKHPRATTNPGDLEFLLWQILGMCTGLGFETDANMPDGDYVDWPEDSHVEVEEPTARAHTDPMVIQQWLAWIADRIATRDGR